MSARPAVPESVARYRTAYRQEVPRFYSGLAHAGFGLLVLAGPAIWHFSRLSGVRPLEWLMVPAALILGNWMEFTIHRYPLHRPFPALFQIYHLHAQQHHRYFTHDAIEFSGPSDFIMVLFPPWAHALAAVGGTAIGWAVTRLGASANLGHLFAAMTCVYMLMYEVCHFCHHVGDQALSARLPWFGSMRGHHREHHNLTLMAEYNFNITFPLFDWIYGTFAPRAADPMPRVPAAA